MANSELVEGKPAGEHWDRHRQHVLDIDPRNGGSQRLRQLKKELGSLPDTVTALTGGGGRHLVFKYPPFTVRKDTSGKKFGKGVDILSDGCIMIAPPSRHATGKRYRWEEGKSYRDLEPSTLPKAWLDRLRSNDSAESHKDNSSVQPGRRILEGQRNISLASLAGTLQRSGTSPAAITAALIAKNEAKCSPPLHKSEVEKIVASITRYPSASPIGDGGDDVERLMRLVLERHFNRGKHLMLCPDGRFWHYDTRLWRPASDQWVSKMVLETIEANPVKKTEYSLADGTGSYRTESEGGRKRRRLALCCGSSSCH
jgi:putative DNA primase/helicase